MALVMIFIVVFVLQGCVWGIATHCIGKSKGQNNCFWWGFFLGLIGLIVVICLNNTQTRTNTDNVEALDKLQKLKENGVITEQEFQEKKKNLLSKI